MNHEVGPNLRSLGVTSAMLLSDDSAKQSTLHIPKVTNGMMLELHSFMNKDLSCTYYSIKTWVMALFGQMWPESNSPTVKALRQSILSLSSRIAK